MKLKNKKILVCGLARSGLAVIDFLKNTGAIISACDTRSQEQIINLKLDLNIKFYFSQNPDKNLILNQDIIILSPGIPCDLDFIKFAHKNKIPVWSEIELAYRFSPWPLISITGTNGKTTTTSLTGQIIKNYLPDSQIAGNIGTPIIKIIKQIQDQKLDLNKNNYLITEISNAQLESINLFKPKISAILNITPDHLDRHKTFENYIYAKSRIFSNQTQQDYLILNFDDKICREFSQQAHAKIIFFSSREKLSSGIYISQNKIKINLNQQEQDLIDIQEINLLGEHNLSNILAATAITICAGIPKKIICDSIKNFKPVEHRLEFVREINQIKFYNDSKGTNVDSSIKALQAIKSPTILIGGGYDKHINFYDWIKNFDRVKYLILIGEVKNKIASQCEELGFKNYLLADSFIEAVKKSYDLASPGDCVLLSPACASWDMFDNFEQRGNLFKQIINSF